MKGTFKFHEHGWVVASITLAVLLQLVFAVTYPLNAGAFDYPVYLEMIRSGTSNLILASGYPFVIHSLLSLLQVPPPQTVDETSWRAVIQMAQNIIHFCFLVGFASLAWRVFGKAVAGWLVVLLGGSTLFLGGLNSAAPEWLQGDLIALSLLVAAKAFIDDRRKVVLYGVAFAVVTVAYLVKPNSLVVVPFLSVLVLLDEASPVRKVLTLGVSGMLAGGLLFLFVTLFHLPSTGSRQLTYDHAWVLMWSLPADYLASPTAELGMNALRWRALGALVPTDGATAYAYPTIDTGASPAERSVYLQRYRDVMQMSRAALVDFVDAHPLPSDFIQKDSAIPLYWYVGFQPIDELGIEVYKESLVSRWPDYLRRVVRGLGAWGALQADIVPFPSQPRGLSLSPAQDSNGFVPYSVPEGDVPQFMRYWNPSETVWAPGMGAMERLSKVVLPRFAEVGLALLSVAAILRVRERKHRMVAAMFLAVIAAYAILSYLLMGLRDKELISLLPTVAIYYGFGLAWLFTLLGARIRTLRARAEPAG